MRLGVADNVGDKLWVANVGGRSCCVGSSVRLGGKMWVADATGWQTVSNSFTWQIMWVARSVRVADPCEWQMRLGVGDAVGRGRCCSVADPCWVAWQMLFSGR